MTQNTTDKRLVVVYVAYGYKKELENIDLFKSSDIHLIIVDTSVPEGDYISELNGWFEFSGYQEGLQRALSIGNDSIQSRYSKTKQSFIFLNSTAFESHLASLTYFTLSRLFNIARRSDRADIATLPVVTGFMMNHGLTSSSIAHTHNFITTWILMLEGTFDDLCQFKFYSSSPNFKEFVTDQYEKLPEIFRINTDMWLQPVGIFRGWYKSIPGVPLPKQTLNRKRFTIYLELNLMNLMATHVCHISDLRDRVSYVDRMFLGILLVTDRFFLNVKKMLLRIRFILFNP